MESSAIKIPTYAARARALLRSGGYEAFPVGGCVRDALLGRTPEDWDIATSATPEEALRVFSGERVLENGLKHGTITPILEGHPVEITTYRIDGAYSDSRRPDSVLFTRSLKDDLARRDFTINAMALDESGGVTDFYGGQKDLAARVVRCVGEPDKRFCEDGLRILRGLRFASVLDFSVEKRTAAALKRNAPLLRSISAERVFAEFAKLLCGVGAQRVLRDFRPVFESFLPELHPLAGFEQHSSYHIYDVWEHTIHAVAAAPAVSELRLSMLLHDIAKPFCFTMGADGRGHFYGHQAKSAEMAQAILTRLKADTHTTETVCTLVRYHDLSISSEEKRIKRWLNKLGEPVYRMLLEVNRADTLAHSREAAERLQTIDEAEACLEEILAKGACFNLKKLAINGNDLIALGVPRGETVGRLLQLILDAVIDGECPNEHDVLLVFAHRFKHIQRIAKKKI